MRAVLDDPQPVPPRRREGPVDAHGDPERVLQQEDLRPGGDALLGLVEVHVEGVRPAVDEDRCGARIANCVRHHHMGRHLQHLVAPTDTHRAQQAVQSDTAACEAVRIADAELTLEGPFVSGDGRPVDQPDGASTYRTAVTQSPSVVIPPIGATRRDEPPIIASASRAFLDG